MGVETDYPEKFRSHYSRLQRDHRGGVDRTRSDEADRRISTGVRRELSTFRPDVSWIGVVARVGIPGMGRRRDDSQFVCRAEHLLSPARLVFHRRRPGPDHKYKG